MQEALSAALVLAPIMTSVFSWLTNRRWSLRHRYTCTRCGTEVRSDWEVTRCVVCRKQYPPLSA